ncbi:MAG: hypothetical protein KDK11_07380 [Maritimibacter sp.]|nr:hypothetical protein [Maritimibacter sp.]
MLRPAALTALFFALTLSGGAPAMAQLSIPVHGNWCGPGHGAGPALDALDAACLRHDLCIRAAGGPFNCACDLAFMDELRRQPWPNPVLQSRARGVFEAITLIPCADPVGQAMKMEWAARDWMGAVLSGRELPSETFTRFMRMMSEAMARGTIR